MLLAALAAIPAVDPASAQYMPPAYVDPRIQTLDYRPGQVYRLEAAPGFQVTVELAPDEQIQSIALGDGAAWQVTANKAGNRLFVKPLQAGVATNMTVVTDNRTYAFDLTGVAEPSASLPYTIGFRYPAVGGSAGMAPMGMPGMSPGMAPGLPGSGFAGVPAIVGRYRLKGDRVLRPKAISDDGTRTYIDWPGDVALPATYTRDRDGREILANGYMRGPFYVIDSVADRLVFRIDKRTARADRDKTAVERGATDRAAADKGRTR